MIFAPARGGRRSLRPRLSPPLRSEPGNIFFEWSRSVENADQFVLVEAFQDDAAAAHVNSDHFKKFVAWAPDYVDESPQIINATIPGTDWSRMAEVTPR